MDSTDTTVKTRTLSMTRDAVRKRIRRDNERFKALPHAEQRVAIAKDVLKWLDQGKLKAQAGRYLTSPQFNAEAMVLSDKFLGPVRQRPGESDAAFNDRWIVAGRKLREARQKRDAQDLLLRDDVTCNVCALGGIFACAVARVDELDMDAFLNTGRTKMHEYLGEFFSSRQLDLIETAFENDRFGTCKHGDENGETVDEDEDHAALAFCDGMHYCTGEFDDEGNEIFNRDYAADRMRAIMENIIANGGEFRP